MLERTCLAQVPFSWVVADSVYGGNHGLRTWLEGHQRSYVLAIPSFEPGSHRAGSPTIGAGAPSHPLAPPEEPSTDEDTLILSTPVTTEEITDSLGSMDFHFLGSASQ